MKNKVYYTVTFYNYHNPYTGEFEKSAFINDCDDNGNFEFKDGDLNYEMFGKYDVTQEYLFKTYDNAMDFIKNKA